MRSKEKKQNKMPPINPEHETTVHIKKFVTLYTDILEGRKPARNMIGDLSRKFGFFAKGRAHDESLNNPHEEDMMTRNKFIALLERKNHYLNQKGRGKVELLGEQWCAKHHAIVLVREEDNAHGKECTEAFTTMMWIKFDEHLQVSYIFLVDQRRSESKG